MINMQEASDLREKVVNNRNIIQSTFSDIHHKANTELLSELRLFLRKPIEYATLYLCPNCYSYCLSFKDSTIQLHVLVPFSIHFNDPGHARQHSNSYILAIHILSSVITKWYIYLLSQVTCLTWVFVTMFICRYISSYVRCRKPLHVVHICSELDPIVSCGSLSTYVAGVSCAVQGKGNLVEVILPKYAISLPLPNLWYNNTTACLIDQLDTKVSML